MHGERHYLSPPLFLFCFVIHEGMPYFLTGWSQETLRIENVKPEIRFLWAP